MGHYTGPKGRINRRLGVQVYENAGAVKALDRRDSPPGGRRRGKLSIYGMALLEKQKLKHYFGLGERTLRRMFAKARRQPGNTGDTLLELCERRLDNVVRRAGFAKTRPQARQGIVHGHIRVNGRKVDQPGYLVRQGDVISVKTRENLIPLYQGLMAESQTELPTWVTIDKDTLSLTVTGLPDAKSRSAPVDIQQVVESLSR